MPACGGARCVFNQDTTAKLIHNCWDKNQQSALGQFSIGRVLRGALNDSADGRPPQLRTDLLRLHQLAMAVFNEGSGSQVAELFDFAVDLQDQVDHPVTSLEQVQETLSQLTALYPESLS